jgi:4-hydroxy-2-oxoheptanedioate aldolase
MQYAMIQSFRQKISEGFVCGPFSKSSDPSFIEILGYTGFDFVVLDLEHGPNDVLSLQNLIRAAEGSGLLPIVRVPEGTPEHVGRVLDVGAGGIQVPNVKSRADVEKAIMSARFSPEGMRGVCRFVRAANYSVTTRERYFSESKEVLVILQLESSEALDNLEEIISVPGVDIVFIGPYDLSQSLRVPGEVDHPRVAEEMKRIIIRCLDSGILVGTFVDTLEDARKWWETGVRYLCYSVDVGLFTEKCYDTVRELRRDRVEGGQR